MNKSLTAILAAILLAGSVASAQTFWDTMQQKKLFNQLSVGVSVGLVDGAGFYVAAPIGNHVQMRAGLSSLMGVSFDSDINVPTAEDLRDNRSGTKTLVKYEGKLTSTEANLLFDIFPFKRGAFRVTAGAFIGGSGKMARVSNLASTRLPDDYNTIGILIKRGTSSTEQYAVRASDGLLTLDGGHASAFKPYIGIGFGRPVPTRRVNVLFDLGAMYGGGLGIYAEGVNTLGSTSRVRLMSADWGKDDDGELNDKGIMDTIHNATKFWPLMRLTLFVRLF